MLNFEELKEDQIPVVVAMMQDFYAIDGYDMDFETSKSNFEFFLKDPTLGQCWFIKEGDLVLGYLIVVYFFSFEFKGKVALLDELYLNADARGKGIGKKAMSFIKSYLKEADAKLILLEIEPHNTAAQKLYESQGFEFHPRKLMRHRMIK